MMAKPERRKSQLNGISAIAPAAPVAPEPTPNRPATPVDSAPAAARPQEPAAAGARSKMAYYAPAADNARIRAAFLEGRNRYGWRSFSDFQLTTILERVELLEKELNGGKQFEGVPPKGGPLGRPLD